ncbi:hypothetical protein DL771_012185 [Monosporascus sp. 5C6A]|nr:hypothetical protein DL771_012185 [Monosporascus sp. 5C6A]
MYLASPRRNLTDLAVACPLPSKRCSSSPPVESEVPELVRREVRAGRLAKVRRSLKRTPGLRGGELRAVVAVATTAWPGLVDGDGNVGLAELGTELVALVDCGEEHADELSGALLVLWKDSTTSHAAGQHLRGLVLMRHIYIEPFGQPPVWSA